MCFLLGVLYVVPMYITYVRVMIPGPASVCALAFMLSGYSYM